MLIRSFVTMAAVASLGLIASSSERADPAGSGGQTQNVSCDGSEGRLASAPSCDSHSNLVAGPSSSRRSKEDIAYVSPSVLEKLSEAALDIRLATFRYKGGDGSRHLGFIIEDSPAIPASDVAHGRVDLYGYTSMALAALQLQARHLAQIELEIDILSNEVEALRGKPPGALSSTCGEWQHPTFAAPMTRHAIDATLP
jgi:endosialidase-like protein